MRFMKETMICPLQSNLRQAKDILKTNKTLVIVGTQRSGKTSLALSLLQAYEESHCLLLTEPEEVMFVKLGETCVVMIDDFTGKYLFDPPRVERWFRKFDVLLAAVKNRQLNVVITSEEAGFSRCCLDFPGHPMLQHVMKMGTGRNKLIYSSKLMINNIFQSCLSTRMQMMTETFIKINTLNIYNSFAPFFM